MNPALSRIRGFTLIELMIAVAVIGILAAIAYPSYTQYVTKSKRSSAQSHLYALANKQEQYLLDTRSYTDTPATLLSTPTEVGANYNITITTGTTPPTYTLTATAKGIQETREGTCKTLTLTQDGTRSPASCW